MKKKLYKAWLIAGIAIIVLSVAATLIFDASVPEDCDSCGMAAVGLVPLWLLSIVVLFVNSIVIPIHNIRNKTKLTTLSALSWV